MKTYEARRAAVALVTIGLHADEQSDGMSLESLNAIGVAKWTAAEWQVVAYALSGMSVGLVRDMARTRDRSPQEVMQSLAANVENLAQADEQSDPV